MQHIKTSSKLIIQRGVRSLCAAGKVNPAANEAEDPLSEYKRYKNVITSQKITLPLVRNIRGFSYSKRCMDLPQGREAVTSLVTDIITEELKVPRDQITLATNFTDLGGNSTNIVTLVVKLRKAGFKKVQISDILNTKTVGDIVKAVAGESDSNEFDKQAEKRYKLHVLDKSGDRNGIVDLITKAFMLNNVVTKYCASEEDVHLHLSENFDIMVQDKLGCYCTNENGKIVACNITFDHEAQIIMTEGMNYAYEVVEPCSAIVDELIEKEGGRWANVFLTLVEPGMDANDAAYLLEKMEDKAEELVKEAGYDGMYTYNTHSATVKYSEYQTAKGWVEVLEFSPHQFFKEKGNNSFENLPEDYFFNAIVKRFK